MACQCSLLLVVSHLVPGFEVANLRSALIAALVIGLVNATLGVFLKIMTFPLTLVTFGLFLLVINALMLMFVFGLGARIRGARLCAGLLGSVAALASRDADPLAHAYRGLGSQS